MKIMPNEESEWVIQVVRYIHSSVFAIQRENSDFQNKKRERMFKMFRQIEHLICLSGRRVF